MSSFSTEPKEGLSQFFEMIWGNVEGFVYLPVKTKENVWKKVYFKWPEHKQYVIEHVLASSAARKDVYFSPVIWNKPSSTVSRTDIIGTNVLWADFDGSCPEEWASIPGQAVSDDPRAVPGPPSVEVQSSTEDHRHVYWKLEEFNNDLDWIENTNRAIAYTYGADTSGWDVEQILRPPYTTNYKHDLPVLVNSFDGTNYRSDNFSSFKPVKELVRQSVDLANLPEPAVVLGKFVIETDTLNLMQKEDIPEGSRSSAMMRIAFRCAELGMSDTEAYSVLLWLDNKWGKFKHRNDRTKRLLDMVNKARQKFPHKIESPTFDGLRLTTTPVAIDVQTVYGFGDFLAQDLRTDWIVNNLVAEGGLGIVASPPGVGKTQLLLNMAMKFSIGKSCVGFTPTIRHKTLFLSLEMGPHHLHRFLSTMAAAYEPEELEMLQRNFYVAPLGESIPLHLPEGRLWLQNTIEQYKPTGVYIDSLGEIHLGDLNKDQEIRLLFSYLRSLRVKYGVYFSIIHHTRKAQENNKKPNKQSDIYGSQYIASSSDYVLS
jgi:hypothetical protein